MLSLALGVTAAIIWAVHDLLARKLSQGLPLLPILIVVLASGTVAMLVPALAFGAWGNLAAGLALSIPAGVSFAIAIGGLYRAFSLAPVRIVSPIVGAYPLLSTGIAALQGKPISAIDWAAVVVIVLGIAVVAIAAEDEAPQENAPVAAMIWAGASAAGFAVTFALGQEVSAAGAEFPAILISRLVAFAAISTLWSAPLWRSDFRLIKGYLPILTLMGVMDALALGLVLTAGSFPRPEYAAVSSALFGVLTVLLAAWFLKERASPRQWGGIALIFSAVAVLSMQV